MCKAEFDFDPHTNEVNVSLFGASGDQVEAVAYGMSFLAGGEDSMPFPVFEDGGEVEITARLGVGAEPRDVAVVLVAAEVLPESVLQEESRLAQAS